MIWYNNKRFRTSINEKMCFLIVIILLLLNTKEGFCNVSFYNDKARGWHWYETKKDDASNKQVQKSPTQIVNDIRNDVEKSYTKPWLSRLKAILLNTSKHKKK
jgi:hypothetical protein